MGGLGWARDGRWVGSGWALGGPWAGPGRSLGGPWVGPGGALGGPWVRPAWALAGPWLGPGWAVGRWVGGQAQAKSVCSLHFEPCRELVEHTMIDGRMLWPWESRMSRPMESSPLQ